MDENLVRSVCWLVAAYLVGAVPFGYLIGRMRGVDVRTVGSKNIGATNVYRTVGKRWGLLAFLCDFAKGFVPTLLCSMYASRHPGGGFWCENLPVFVGLACVVGHTLTVFMRFRGGKGVATAFGMFLALAPYPTLAAFGVFVVTVWLWHYISLGSILAALVLGAEVWFSPATLLLRVVADLIAVFVVVKHRTNIQRLVKGCENRIY